MNIPITYKLNSITNLINQTADTHLRNAYGIMFSEFLILAVLGSAIQLQQKDLALYTKLSKAMVSRNIFDLVRKKLVRINKDDTDRRVDLVSLTEKGKKTTVRAKAELEKMFRKDILKNMKASDVKKLDKLLDAMLMNSLESGGI